MSLLVAITPLAWFFNSMVNILTMETNLVTDCSEFEGNEQEFMFDILPLEVNVNLTRHPVFKALNMRSDICCNFSAHDLLVAVKVRILESWNFLNLW